MQDMYGRQLGGSRMLNMDPSKYQELMNSLGVPQPSVNPMRQPPMSQPQIPQPAMGGAPSNISGQQGYNQMLRLSGMNSQAITPRQTNRLGFLENKFRRMG